MSFTNLLMHDGFWIAVFTAAVALFFLVRGRRVVQFSQASTAPGSNDAKFATPEEDMTQEPGSPSKAEGHSHEKPHEGGHHHHGCC
jgi:hypothetical protein